MRLSPKIFRSVSLRSFILGAVIIFAIGAFVFTGFGSLHLGGISSLSPSLAAEVGSQQITLEQLSSRMAAAGLGNQPVAERENTVRGLIDQMVKEAMLTDEATRLGFTASTPEISNVIRTIPTFQDSSTKVFSQQRLKEFLNNQQLNEVTFYKTLRAEVEAVKLLNLLGTPVLLSQNTLANFYNLQNTSFVLEYSLLEINEAKLNEILQTQIQDYLSKPENIVELQKTYGTQKNRFSQKAGYNVRSILIAHRDARRAQGDALSRTKVEAKHLAESLLKQIRRNRTDFKKIAEKNNDDTQARSAKGELGFIDETTLDSESLAAVKRLNKQNSLSAVVETPFGYRIFELVDSRPAVNRTFDEVKEQLVKDALGPQLSSQQQAQLQSDMMVALATKDQTKVDSLFKNYGLSWRKMKNPYTVNTGFIEGLGSAEDLASQIFSLKKPGDQISTVVFFSGRPTLIRLVERQTPKTADATVLFGLEQQMQQMHSALFQSSYVESLYKNYENDGLIHINSSLFTKAPGT